MLLGVWLYYLGFVSAAREKSHIHARVIESAMKKNETIAKLRMLNAFVAVIICLYLIDLAWNFFKYSLRVGKTTSILMYPMIFYESAPIICFVPALFYTVAELVFYAKRIKKSDIDFIGEREEVKEYLQNTQNGKGGSKR
jgi:TRAP-type C4-dicarboxylate transport system permease small subunit